MPRRTPGKKVPALRNLLSELDGLWYSVEAAIDRHRQLPDADADVRSSWLALSDVNASCLRHNWHAVMDPGPLPESARLSLPSEDIGARLDRVWHAGVGMRSFALGIVDDLRHRVCNELAQCLAVEVLDVTGFAFGENGKLQERELTGKEGTTVERLRLIQSQSHKYPPAVRALYELDAVCRSALASCSSFVCRCLGELARHGETDRQWLVKSALQSMLGEQAAKGPAGVHVDCRLPVSESLATHWASFVSDIRILQAYEEHQHDALDRFAEGNRALRGAGYQLPALGHVGFRRSLHATVAEYCRDVFDEAFSSIVVVDREPAPLTLGSLSLFVGIDRDSPDIRAVTSPERLAQWREYLQLELHETARLVLEDNETASTGPRKKKGRPGPRRDPARDAVDKRIRAMRDSGSCPTWEHIVRDLSAQDWKALGLANQSSDKNKSHAIRCSLDRTRKG